MNALTQALYDRLTGDATLTAMLATYDGGPAIFTTDPPPGDAALPYVVSSGAVTQTAYDTKTTRGRQIYRDVRAYAELSGSAIVVDNIAERVRTLLHRQPLTVTGFGVWIAECSGPILSDEQHAYGRIITLRLIAMEV